MIKRGQGRGEYHCLVQNNHPHTYTCIKTGKPPVHTFSYVGMAEFPDVDSFLKDVSQSLFEQTLVEANGQYSHLPKSPKPLQGTVISTSRANTDFCFDCGGDGRCDLKYSFQEATQVRVKFTLPHLCPSCGEALSLRSNPKGADLSLYDVRLAGRPTTLVIEKKRAWYCSQCKKRLFTLRIPTLQGTVRGKFTLRLLLSLLLKKLDETPSSLLAEAYDVNDKTINKLLREYMAYLEDIHTLRLQQLLAQSATLYKERFYLKGKPYWAIIDVEKNTLLTIVSDQGVAQVNAFLAGGAIPTHPESAMVMCCTFAALNPSRYHLTMGFLTLMQTAAHPSQEGKPIPAFLDDDSEQICAHTDLARERMRAISDYDRRRWRAILDRDRDEVQALSNDDREKMRILVEQVVFAPKLSPSNLYKWWDRWGRYMEMPDTVRKQMEEEFHKIVESVPVTQDRTYGNAYAIDEDLYQNREQSLRHFLWNNHAPLRIREPFMPFFNQLQQASADSKLRGSAQIERLLYFNEPSLSKQGSISGITLHPDGLPDVDHALIGTGVPLACLQHLLKHGLLQSDGVMSPCLRANYSSRAQEDQSRCPLRSCPLFNAF